MIKMTEEIKDAKTSFQEKHPPLSPKQVYERIQDSAKGRKKYLDDIDRAEEYLLEFLNTEDPLIDPGTGRAIGWIRHIPYMEFVAMIPKDLVDEKDDEALLDRLGEDQGFLFKWMERLVSRPSWTEQEWRDRATPRFIELFSARLQELFLQTEEKIDFFSQRLGE